MKQKITPRPRMLFGILTGVSLAVAAVCLMTACIDIYRQGEFTREIVAARFRPIALPVYVALALTAGGFLLDLLLPSQSPKPKAGRQTALILARLESKADLSACDDGLRNAIVAQRQSRARCAAIRTGLLLLSALLFLAYALNGNNFHSSDINASMLRAMVMLLPCLAVCFGFGIFTAYHNTASMEQEIALLKQAPKKAAAAFQEAPARPSEKRRNVLRALTVCLAAALLLYGYFSGGTADVLTKAVNICTECVGLG